jgi:hypothetical protein
MSTETSVTALATNSKPAAQLSPEVAKAGLRPELSPAPEQKIVIENKIELPQRQVSFSENYPLAIPFLTVLISVLIAHSLTRQRDRDKAIQDLLASLEQQITLACDAASAAWEERKGPKRVAFVAQAIGRVQLIAASIERLKSQSERYNRKFGPFWLPFPEPRFIDASDAIISFRRQITSEPFDDRTRNADKSQLECVEFAKLQLIAILQAKWADWAFGPIRPKQK